MRRCSTAIALVAVLATSAKAEPAAWKDGDRRLFVAGEAGAGLVLKAQVAAGWGRPHWWWYGGEALALSTFEFGAAYAGVRARLPFLDASAGVRRTRSYVHPLLATAPSHASLAGDARDAAATSFDVSLTLYTPAPRGYGMLWIDGVHLVGLDADRELFEELQRAVVGAGTTVTARGAYLASVARGDVLLGPMVEHVWLGGRDGVVWRAGAAGYYELSPRWQLALVLTAVITSADDLGLVDGAWGTGLVRYRWASGTRRSRDDR